MLRQLKILLFTSILSFFPAEAIEAAEPLVINELMASNSNSKQDPQGQYDDWIEIYNNGTSTIDIGGMYLTDDLSDPTKWQIPSSTTVPAGGYILIWADNDTTDAGLHANFKLDADGEEIGLFDIDGENVIDSIEYPEQTGDISYGRYPDAGDEWRFFDIPSPEEENEDGFPGVVADTKFNRERGFYDAQFHVAITTKTQGATIRYTTDGSTPTQTHGLVYNSPVLISTTTCLRAMAFKQDWLPTNVDTQTYIFLDDVIEQTGAGFPDTWGHLGADYEMDPVVVSSYDETIRDDLKSIPTVSLVMDMDDWFNDNSNPAIGGIYANPEWENNYDDEAERAVSVEFFDPGGDLGQFQINAGVRIAGGTSTENWKSDKLSMRLKFQEQYGPTKLKYPLFEEGAAQSFDTLVLDARLNNVWNYGNDNGQRERAQYTRDQFTSDIQNAMGGYGHHGLHVHLYLNGLYWGLYNLHERPDESFAASYFGGNKENYDVIKHKYDPSQASKYVVQGSYDNYNEMFDVARAGLSSDSQYQLIQQYLDVPNFIDYMITNFYIGNTDWAHQNWYASRNLAESQGRWRYHSWDAEHVLKGLNDNIPNSGRRPYGSPLYLHDILCGNGEYRMLFADRVHRHFFNNGVLTVDNASALYQLRLNEVDRAVVGESARWGDNRIEQGGIRYTRDEHWVAERDRLLNEYFPRRTEVVLNRLKSRDLYPDVDAPAFHINGSYQHGGWITKNSRLSATSDSGTILYTLDGSDPRLPGTTGDSMMTTLIADDATKRVLVPTGPVNDNWKGSGLFDESDWTSGTGGVGYDTGSEYRYLINIDLYNQMYQGQTSCYIRIPFDLTQDPDQFDSMTLRMRYDDGFIAYINGIEIARSNAPTSPQWNSTATAQNSDSAAVNFQDFDISSHSNVLSRGENILAIHGLNISPGSSDFLISAELVVYEDSSSSDVDIPAGVLQYTEPITLTKSINIKARVLVSRSWSALNEATYAVGPVAENLRITEIMYHPQSQAELNDPNEEFIELANIGTETINLNLVKFTNGIDFTFPSLELAPGEYIVIVQDVAAFEDRYGTEINIGGEYTGRLNNAGERIKLEDAIGQTILDFSYNDGWYSITDGYGFSLTIIDPTNTDTDSWDQKDSWRASAHTSGSPGRDDGDQ